MTINQVTDTKKIQEAGSPGGGRGGPTTLETHEVAYICTYGRIAWLGTCSKGPGTPEAVLQCCLGLPRKSTSSRPTLSNISRSLFDALFFLSFLQKTERAREPRLSFRPWSVYGGDFLQVARVSMASSSHQTCRNDRIVCVHYASGDGAKFWFSPLCCQLVPFFRSITNITGWW